MKEFMHREPGRKKSIRDWTKWWKENHVNVERKVMKMKQTSLVDDKSLESEEQETPKKKYSDEAYM